MHSLSVPAHSKQLVVDIPAEHVLQVTFNRPEVLNAMNPTMTSDMEAVLKSFEQEPELWVLIVAGDGRLFCAGADLKAWNDELQGGQDSVEGQHRTFMDQYGFASLSKRQSRKPIIAAVTGGAYGGGVELLLNCDLVVADASSKFALPEVKRGVIAGAGGIPRLFNASGHQRASEMLLLGGTISVEDARDRFGFVNYIVPRAAVLSRALQLAVAITHNSPDAVQATKRGLLLAQRHNVDEAVTKSAMSAESNRAYGGHNIKEGLQAFAMRRSPKWRNPAKL
ncbi:ClpP/crotonase [Fistulina hepatica ATCC 64428]|uniref:ClpP/crotonase n=1 Tax=Fistulina hepatica ATCC 64428 TaxID=1128425 RepID=A0A0D7A2N9_9AGAR|nr:ClpP/crotonase [Fistulina hepatica ATCC 64428]